MKGKVSFLESEKEKERASEAGERERERYNKCVDDMFVFVCCEKAQHV